MSPFKTKEVAKQKAERKGPLRFFTGLFRRRSPETAERTDGSAETVVASPKQVEAGKVLAAAKERQAALGEEVGAFRKGQDRKIEGLDERADLAEAAAAAGKNGPLKRVGRWFSKIPVIGYFFRAKTAEHKKAYKLPFVGLGIRVIDWAFSIFKPPVTKVAPGLT